MTDRRSRSWLVVLLAMTAAVALYLVRLWTARSIAESPPSSAVSPSSSSLRPTTPASRARRVRYGATSRQTIALSDAERTDSPGAIGALEGVVLSRGDGHPIAGALLSFAAGELFTVRSASDGSFRFAPPRQDVYELSLVTAPDHLAFAPEWGHSPLVFVAREGSGLRGARVYLTPAVGYTVLVLNRAGEPVKDATVEVLGARIEGAALADAAAAIAPTDDQGQTLLVAADGAIVEASHPSHGRGRGRIDLAAQVQKRVTIRLDDDMAARVELAGRAIDPEGSPVPDALVVARFDADNPALPSARLVPEERTVSDESGRFAMEVDAGRYVVIATAPGMAPATERGVEAPRGDLELRLGRGAALYGRVTDAGDGAPIVSFVVLVARPRGALAREVVTVEPTLDPEGRYEIPALPPGSYEVSVSASGRAMSPPRALQIAEEDVEASFALERGGRIRGRVIDAEDGAPLGAARVTLEGRLDGLGEQPLSASATTADDGTFDLAGVGEGPQSVLAAAADHHARLLAGLLVPAGGLLEITLELSRVADGEEPTIELAGIGAVLSAKDDVLLIGHVVEGGGAAEAGLTVGDAILAVDGAPVARLGFAGSIQRIRGPEGTAVQLSVRKVGAEDAVTLAVTRRRLRAR